MGLILSIENPLGEVRRKKKGNLYCKSFLSVFVVFLTSVSGRYRRGRGACPFSTLSFLLKLSEREESHLVEQL